MTTISRIIGGIGTVGAISIGFLTTTTGPAVGMMLSQRFHLDPTPLTIFVCGPMTCSLCLCGAMVVVNRFI